MSDEIRIITHAELVEANREAIKAGMNRALKGLHRLPKNQVYLVDMPFRHVNWEGKVSIRGRLHLVDRAGKGVGGFLDFLPKTFRKLPKLARPAAA